MDNVYDVYCNGVWQCTWPNQWLAIDWCSEGDRHDASWGHKPRYWSVSPRRYDEPLIRLHKAMADRFAD